MFGSIFPVVDCARQGRLRQAFSAAVRSTKRPSNPLAAIIGVMGCCRALDKALTFDLSGRRHNAVIERARTNKLGGLLAHMIDVTTYVHRESMHSGLLAS